MAKFTKVKEELLAEQLEDQIYDMIVTENYQTGDKIPSENKLAIKYNVGRSTIREAIKILVSKNVLKTVKGSGTYVKNIVPSDLDPLNLRDLEDRLTLAIVGVKGEKKTPEEMETILAERRAQWQPKPQKYTKGLLKLYAQHAVSPMKGAYME